MPRARVLVVLVEQLGELLEHGAAELLGIDDGDGAAVVASDVVADVEKLRDEAKRLHKKVEIVIYPDTPHGFNADYRPSYRPDAAKDGWQRMLAWFKSHGVA